MKKYIKEVGRDLNPAEVHLIERLSEGSWKDIKTVINIVREPVLILDKDLRVMAANESFYRMFQVEQVDTEHTLVYELGNGQWAIPALRKLLEEILPKNNFFKDFEVIHNFPMIGEKSMLLNARRIHFTDDVAFELFPPIILLAIEDITPMMMIAETLAVHAKGIAAQSTGEVLRLEMYIDKLEKEIREIKRVS